MISVALGDPHAVPSQIGECARLLAMVRDTVVAYKAEALTIFGDLHDSHDTVSVRVSDLWHRALASIPCRKILLVGNHDQAYTDRTHPHALQAYAAMEGVEVIDRPVGDVLPGVAMMPYYYDPAKFVDDAADIAAVSHNPDLFCHQTFNGGRYENGFYARDAVEPSVINFFDRVWSGHIHLKQEFAQIRYIGAPRWRTRSDANVDRYVYVLEHDGAVTREVARVSTGSCCRRIWTGEDRPGAPFEFTPEMASTDDVRVDVFGPDASYVRTRSEELRARGAVTRPFPDRAAAPSGVSESVGLEESLDRFASAWKAPNGSSPAAVLAEVRRRVAA